MTNFFRHKKKDVYTVIRTPQDIDHYSQQTDQSQSSNQSSQAAVYTISHCPIIGFKNFTRDIKPKLKDQTPDIQPLDLLKQAGRIWNYQLSGQERREWQGRMETLQCNDKANKMNKDKLFYRGDMLIIDPDNNDDQKSDLGVKTTTGFGQVGGQKGNMSGRNEEEGVMVLSDDQQDVITLD